MESEESIQVLSEVEWLETFIRGMLDKSSWYFRVFQRIFSFLKTQQNLSFDAQIFLVVKWSRMLKLVLNTMVLIWRVSKFVLPKRGGDWKPDMLLSLKYDNAATLLLSHIPLTVISFCGQLSFFMLENLVPFIIPFYGQNIICIILSLKSIFCCT